MNSLILADAGRVKLSMNRIDTYDVHYIQHLLFYYLSSYFAYSKTPLYILYKYLCLSTTVHKVLGTCMRI